MRIDLQVEAYGKEEETPAQLFAVYEKWKAELSALKEKCGSVVPIDELA